MITTLEYYDRIAVWRHNEPSFAVYKPTQTSHGQFILKGWTQIAPWVFTYNIVDHDGTVYPICCTLDSTLLNLHTVEAIMLPLACVEYPR